MIPKKLQHPNLCRIRTITAFISLNQNSAEWLAVLQDAKKQCQILADALTAQGYTIQSLRMVTNPFGEYLNTANKTPQNRDSLI